MTPRTLAPLLLAAWALAPACIAQGVGDLADPRVLFAPFDTGQAVNRYRAANGMPGPDYWQNGADYAIRATLDAQAHALAGEETITYTNRSPQALRYLWLQLDQNHYRDTARANFSADAARAPGQATAGFVLDSVALEGAGRTQPLPYRVDDTRMRIDLPQPVAAQGGQVRLQIAWHFTVPGAFGGRTDWFASEHGEIFEIAQWYPRLCVFDDLHGWDTAPYLNSEFHLEYGDFDYRITVPADMLVVASGELVNADEVLAPLERARLAQARNSDATVMIRTPAEVAAAPRASAGATRTWHFRMQHARDVAFGASRAFAWDAARIRLPGGGSALAMSAYPAESVRAKDGWQRSTEYVKASIEYFSRQLGIAYPWPVAVAEAGIAGGMEYPGIVFDDYRAHGKSLYAVTAHEVGHSWFPMIVGSDERHAAWMDEGMNTFVDVLAANAFNGGEFAPKRDSEFAPGGGNPVDEILPLLGDAQAPTILARADLIAEKYRHPVTYFKAALGLMLLRDVVLGAERFDAAFQGYVRAWSLRHPSPADFFRAMENGAGEDLSWFWREWFAANVPLDFAVTGVAYRDGDPAHGALVTVARRAPMVLPVELQVEFAGGGSARVRVPVETWMQHTQFAVAVPGNRRIVAARVDPQQRLPDADRANDTWRASP